MVSTQTESSTNAGSSRREEFSLSNPQCARKIAASVTALHRHAGEVIPNLWVGDIRSVSFIEELVQMSTKRCAGQFERQKKNSVKRRVTVTLTVISVISNSNLLKYVADSLDQKRKYFLHRQQWQNEQNAEKIQSGKQDGLECNVREVEEKAEQCEIVGSRKTGAIDSSIITSETNFVSMQTNKTADSVYDTIDIDIRHIEVPLRDSLNSDLMSVLRKTLTLIDEALGVCQNSINGQRDNGLEKDTNSNEDGCKICLVHCAKGASRSVSIIIGYLLSRHSNQFSSFDAALTCVRLVRPNARPNVRFAVDLRRFANETKK